MEASSNIRKDKTMDKKNRIEKMKADVKKATLIGAITVSSMFGGNKIQAQTLQQNEAEKKVNQITNVKSAFSSENTEKQIIFSEDGNKALYPNGQVAYIMITEPTVIKPDKKQGKEHILLPHSEIWFYDNGSIAKESSVQGAFMKDDAGRKKLCEVSTVREWHENGNLHLEFMPVLSSEKVMQGTRIRMWHENGRLKGESLPNGTECEWDINGKKTFQRKNGKVSIWSSNGKRHDFQDKGNFHYERYDNGNLKSIHWLDAKEKMEYDQKGNETAHLDLRSDFEKNLNIQYHGR